MITRFFSYLNNYASENLFFISTKSLIISIILIFVGFAIMLQIKDSYIKCPIPLYFMVMLFMIRYIDR